MKRYVLLIAAVVSVAASCPPKPPNPTPSPTPSPTTPPSASLLLSRNGTVFTTATGIPVDLKGSARCCFTDNSVEDQCDPGWALVSRCAIQDTATRGGADTMIHVRLGPYRAQPDWGAEQLSAGSPYLEVNNLADLTQWDPKFMAYMKDKATYAASLGVRLEIDIADGWGLKWQKATPNAFPQGHPWVASSNLQHQDWITSAGTGTPVGIHDAWIRHVVDELGSADNITYQVGNEDEQIRGIVADWEIGTCNIVHDEEAKRGYKKHLCGSNAPNLVANRAEIDYLTTHDNPPFTRTQCRDNTRPCRQNEDNNDYSGDLWGQLYCNAKSQGLYRDLWRANMGRPDFNQAFTYLKNGCSGAAPVGCFDIPDQDAIQVLPKPADKYATQVNAALKKLHPECDVNSNCPINEPMQQFLQKFAAQIRTDPTMCAGIQTTPEGPVDEVCVGDKVVGTTRCDLCQGNHVFACKSGCTTGTVSWAPGSYVRASDTWKRPSATVAAASAPSRIIDFRHGVDKPIRSGRVPPALPPTNPN